MFLLQWTLSRLQSLAIDCISSKIPMNFIEGFTFPFYQLVNLELHCPFPVEASSSLLLAAPCLQTLKLVTFQQPDYFFHELCCSHTYFERDTLNLSFLSNALHPHSEAYTKRQKIGSNSNDRCDNKSPERGRIC